MMDFERVFCREPASPDLSYLVVEDRELKEWACNVLL